MPFSPSLALPKVGGGRRLLQNHKTLTLWIQWILHASAIIATLYLCTIAFSGSAEFPDRYMVLAVIAGLLIAIVYNTMGVFRRYTGTMSGALRITQAWLITLGCLFAIAFITKSSEQYSRAVVSSWAVLALLAQYAIYLVWHWLFQAWQRAFRLELPTLVIGTGSLAQHLVRAINGNPFLPDQVIGVLDGSANADHWDDSSAPLLGDLNALDAVLASNEVDRIYVALPVNRTPEIVEIQRRLFDRNVDVIWAPDIFAFNLLNHSVREIAGIPLISLSESPLIMGGRAYLKSLMDVVISLAALIVLSPLMLLVAAMIKFSSPGPIFYRQPRHGWDGTVFKVWKFRSMYIDQPEPDRVIQATKDDPRVTPVGRFLRKTSIDELPQLFNVLQGTMSLVGPRPHALVHNDEFSRQIADYMARHRIKPGITGLAQIHGLRGETDTVEKMRSRVKYDMEYINNWSLKMDLVILLKTPFTLWSHNAY